MTDAPSRRFDPVSLALAVGLFVCLAAIALFTRGWVRGSLGDLVVVVWLANVLTVAGPLRGRPVWGAAAALSVAVGLEGLQLLDLVERDSPFWMHMVFGATFDPLDLVHYAVGAVLAGAIGWGRARHPR